MLRASAMRSAPCRASRSTPSMGTSLRLCARAELLRAPAAASKPTLSLSICTPPPRAVFVTPDAMLRRLYSTGPKKPASAPTPAPSSHSTNHVDLLSKYEERAERKQRFVRWSTVLLALLAIAGLILWYMEGHRASKDILETVGALSEQGAPNSKEPPVYHLRKLYERARTNEHWMQAVQAESVGLLEILRPYLDSKDKDERIYASLLVSYIAAGSRTQKKAVIDGGYVDVMLKYTDIPTRVATILTLSRIAEKWFAGEMKSIFRDNAAISKFINECSEEHEPLLQAYAKRILYNTGSKSLGRQLSASNDLLIKAFDYTQKTDKESMAKAIKDAVDGEPKNAYFQFCQAYWFHLMGFAKEAKIAYTKSLGINQGQVDALYELGRIYLVEFHPDRTAILWSRALQENPNFVPLVKWLDDFEARKDNTREDLVTLHRTLTALRTGGDVSVAKAAPLIPAELPGAPAAATQPSALQSVAAAVVPALGAGPRPQHTPPPPAAQQQQQQ